MANDRRSWLDKLDWLPVAGAAAWSAQRLHASGDARAISQAYTMGAKAGAAADRFARVIKESRFSGMNLPKHLGADKESYILGLVKHAMGAKGRFALVNSFDDVNKIRNDYPELFEEVYRKARNLSGVDLGGMLRPNQLGHIPEAQVFSEAMVRGSFGRFLQGNVRSDLHNPLVDLRTKYHQTFGLRDSQIIELRHQGELVGLRMTGGRNSRAPILELPILTSQGQMISSRGNLMTPFSWRTKASGWKEELPMDAYTMRRLEEGMSHEAMSTGRAGSFLQDIVRGITEKAVYDSHETMQQTRNPIAQEFVRHLARVEAEDSREVGVARKAVVEHFWHKDPLLDQDLTSHIPEGPASKGVVFEEGFDPRLYTRSGYLAPDKKLYQTLSKPFNLADEAKLALSEDLDRSGVAHLFLPGSAGSETGRFIDQGHFNLQLNYGMLDLEGEELKAFQAKVNQRFGTNIALSMHEDEIFLAEEAKLYWQQERPFAYTLRQESGVSNLLQAGAELAPNTFLGTDPLGREVFSGERGGREFVENIERQGENVVARIRNLLEPTEGTKVFGTGRIKNTVKGFLQADTLQTIYSMYLTTKYKGVSEKRAQQMAANITGLTMSKSFKNGEPAVEELVGSLAEQHLIFQRQGHQSLANQAADELRKLGFDYQEGRPAPWRRERYNFGQSAESVFNMFKDAKNGPLRKVYQEYEMGLRRETVTMGGTMEDLGAGRPASMSAELFSTLADLGHDSLGMDILDRVNPKTRIDLQEIFRMQEPFTGKYKTGLGVDKLDAGMLTGENSILDWLAPRNPDMPRTIHFGHTYQLHEGQMPVSYLQLPEQVTELFKGVPTGEDSSAASELYKTYRRALNATQAHARAGFIPGALENQATEALENVALQLSKSLLTKEGAMRQALGGKVSGSAILQASSKSWQGLHEAANPGDVFINHQRFLDLTREITEDEQAKILGALGHGQKYSGLEEAFAHGESIPMVMARYPQERKYSAMPVQVRSADYANRRYTRRFGASVLPQLSDKQAYIDPAIFQLMGGDYDSDTVHMFMLKGEDAVRNARELLVDQGWAQKHMTLWDAQLKATKGARSEEDKWFTTIVQRLGRVKQQEAGKTGIGPVSNALGRIRAGNRLAGQVDKSYWTEWIGEGAIIKARNWGLERFSKEDIVQQTLDRLTSLNETPEVRARWLYDEMIGPTREGAGDAAQVQKDIMASLHNYHETFRGSRTEQFMRLFKVTPDQVTATKGLQTRSRVLSMLEGARDWASALIGGSGDTNRVRSFIRNKAAGLTAATESLGRAVSHNKAILGGGLLVGAGLAMLRKPKNLTPEGVTGSDLSAAGGLAGGNVTMQMVPRARVMERQDGLNIRVRGRSTHELTTGQLGQDLSQAVRGRTQINVEDRRRPLTREDLRRLRR